MDASSNIIQVAFTLLLFTSFIKITTVLTICRYGLGLIGFEFGAVCLVVGVVLALVASPPELEKVGFPGAMFSSEKAPSVEVVAEALLPFMRARVDPDIDRGLSALRSKTAASVGGAAAEDSLRNLRGVAPAFVLSELKSAFQVGCMLLVPLVVIDLLSAHLLALLGVQQIAATVVSLPLKLLVFIAAGGWGLLGKKLLGIE